MDLFAARQTRQRFVNSLFYCHQAVMEEHEAHLLNLEVRPPAEPSPPRRRRRPQPKAPPGAAAPSRPAPMSYAGSGAAADEMGVLARKHPGTAIQEAAERVLARLDALSGMLDGGARVDPARLEVDLAAMDEVLVPVLEAALDGRNWPG